MAVITAGLSHTSHETTETRATISEAHVENDWAAELSSIVRKDECLSWSDGVAAKPIY